MHGRVPTPDASIVERETDIRSIWFILLRRSRVIIGMAGTILLLTVFVVFTLTPRYTATSQIMLDPRRPNLTGGDSLTADLPFDQASLDNQMALIQSRALLSRVVEGENLVQDDEFGQGKSVSLLGLISSIFSSNSVAPPAKDTTPSTGPNDAAILNSVSSLRGSVGVERFGRTFILSISVTSRSPDKAARLANAIANAYIVDQLEARFEAAQRASRWLGDRLERLRKELRESESAVARFRNENGLGAAVTGAISESQMVDFNARLASARAETVEKKTRLDQAQRIIAEGGNALSIPDVSRSPVMSALSNQRGQISQREADLIARYGDHHPSVVNVRAERQDIERQIRVEIGRTVAALKNDYDVAKTRQESLERSMGVVTGQGGLDNAVAVQLRELERVSQANKTLYETFLARFKLSEEQANLEVREARIVSLASAPGTPSFPRRGLISAIALACGLGVGVAMAFLLETLQRGFTTPGEIEQQLEVPALASVPQLTDKDLRVGGQTTAPIAPMQYLLRKPMSRYGEAIRTIRAGIQMSDVDHPPKVIQVSSVMVGEGKTTIAISLAQSAATTMPRVLLIDCDLRRPQTTKTFGLDKKPGLVDLLVGSSAVERPIARDPASGIHILGAGSATQNAPDLLSSGRLRAVIEQMRDLYDYIILDSPPVGPVIDAIVLSNCADKVVFVVAWNDTPRDLVARSLKQFPQQKKIAGIILNRLDTNSSTRYASYYYSKYYNKYYTS